MRKLKLQVQMSVDGFVAGPDGEMDWMTWEWDEKLMKYVGDLTEPVDCILLGRKMAKGFIDSWEGRAAEQGPAEPFSMKMDNTVKVVFSQTLRHIDWKNAMLADRKLDDYVNWLKEQEGGDIIVYGGAGFVASLIRHNLIDDYFLFINPAAIGKGLPIFTGKLPLRLVSSTAFDCGITAQHYQPVKP
jgi:dihydrofolate reductase